MTTPDHKRARRSPPGVPMIPMIASTMVGYVIGSFPSADVAAKLAGGAGSDLREVGSGNPGAVNAAQVLGPGWGAAVLVMDVAKGAIAGVVGRGIAADAGGYAAATASIGGHIFPVWSRFRGGKGVATAAGAVLAVFPAYFPVDLAVATAGAAGLRNAQRVTWVNTAVWVGASVLWTRRRWSNGWGPRPGPGLVAFSVVGAGMIVWKFRVARRPIDASPPGRDATSSAQGGAS